MLTANFYDAKTQVFNLTEKLVECGQLA